MKAREVAILATGAHFCASYESYAHSIVAEHYGVDEHTIATIVAGQHPPTLTEDEGVSYDVASAVLRGGIIPEPTYKAAIKQFGPDGTAELIYFIGLYSMIAVTLNGFNVPVPEPAD